MTYLIIIFVIAVALGPIFWMMPSPRQKRQALLREYAMAQGFTLKVCDLPQSHRDKVRKEDVKEGIAYRLAVKKTEGSAGKRQYNGANVMFCNRENGEQTDNCSEHLRTVLVQLPEDIVAIEYSAPWLCVYWQERGTIEDIDLIKGKLEELGSLL